jgi:hypothetical protein
VGCLYSLVLIGTGWGGWDRGARSKARLVVRNRTRQNRRPIHALNPNVARLASYRWRSAREAAGARQRATLTLTMGPPLGRATQALDRTANRSGQRRPAQDVGRQKRGRCICVLSLLVQMIALANKARMAGLPTGVRRLVHEVCQRLSLRNLHGTVLMALAGAIGFGPCSPRP